jgi:RNA polymerase sigma-70 factor (ECF subfamily)
MYSDRQDQIIIVTFHYDAEDIAQDVFIQAHSWFDTLQSHENPGGWLRTTCRNKSINHVLRYKRRFLFVELSDLDANEALQQEQPEDDDWLCGKSEMLKAALLKIPDHLRISLVLFYYEDMEYKKIAETLKISLSKVKVDIMRAKMKLKKEIEKLEKTYAA